MTANSVSTGPFPRILDTPLRLDPLDERHKPGDAIGGAARAGRGVLEGALVVLDALAGAQDGIGLSQLARVTGLAKTSAYRLAEQLVTVGAAQRLARRYYVGERVARIGQHWQPDPLVRQAAQTPVHQLAACSGSMASLRILHQDRLRVICATAPHGQAFVPNPADRASTARTATGRVLYATQPASELALPDCWSPREWRALRARIRDAHTTVTDHQDAIAGVCCVSAPVWWPDATCAGALTAVVSTNTIAPTLPELVSRIAHRITTTLATMAWV